MSSVTQPAPILTRDRAAHELDSHDGLRAECPRHDVTLDLLGRLLCYPDTDFDDILAQALGAMDSLPLIAFHSALGALNSDEREELYTATFDVTPCCAPYVSIHLFGEQNFKRGEFMAALHSQYEQTDFPTHGELPDHIALLLRYTATLGEPARRELVEFCLLGPLVKIIAALPADHPYRLVLDAIEETLRTAYPGIQAALSPVEQMRRHGICPTVAEGCNCGPLAAAMLDGPDDIVRVDGCNPAAIPTARTPTISLP